jgi:MYXO-CTERM domain-containing protein
MNDTQCLAAIYSRTDAHKDLIINAAKKAAELGTYDSADWVKGVTPAAVPAGNAANGCEGDTCSSTDPTEPSGAAPAETTVTKTTTGCSSAPGTAGSNGALFGLALAGALIVSRRRR